MKKKIIILIFFAFWGLLKANAYTVAVISGTVTNTLTTAPAVAHTVIITDSISYTQVHYTDSNGFYFDSIVNNSPNSIKYYILVYDCNNIMHYDTVTTSGYVMKMANFSICYNFVDVGIIDIINPTNVGCTGNAIYPKIIIKNFGTTPLTSIPVAYQRGSLPPVYQYWNNPTPLNSGDTASYIFTNSFMVPMGTYFPFTAFTSLVNDVNPLNNKIQKNVTINFQMTPVNIDGDDTVIIGQSNVVYSSNFLGMVLNSQYIWTLPPGAVIDSVYANSIVVHFLNNAQSGNITCKIMNFCGVSSTIVLPISVFVTPPPPIIFQNGNTLNSGYSTGNQWYFENNAIAGATQSSYTPTQTGHYHCTVTLNGITSNQSNTLYIAFAGIERSYLISDFEVFPNPSNDITTFKYSLKQTSKIELKITDIEGKLVKSLVNTEQSSGDYNYQLDVKNINKGIYFYQFKVSDVTTNGKLIIIK